MFYLVGSRFFGQFRPDSDWDYIGADTPQNRELLEKSGYKKLESPYTRYWKNGIDICLVSNLAAQLYARDRVMEECPHLPKSERHVKIMEFVDAYQLG